MDLLLRIFFTFLRPDSDLSGRIRISMEAWLWIVELGVLIVSPCTAYEHDQPSIGVSVESSVWFGLRCRMAQDLVTFWNAVVCVVYGALIRYVSVVPEPDCGDCPDLSESC